MTPHTRAGQQRTALRRLAPFVITLGIGGGVVVAATGGLQTQNAPLHFTASGSTAPVGNGTNNGNTDPTTGCNGNGNCFGPDKQFKVTVQPKPGDSRKLWPGGSSTLQVTYTNPFAFGIQVASTKPEVAVGTAPQQVLGLYACTKGYIGTSLLPATAVPGGGSTKPIDLIVTMSPTAPDACKQATWSITVSAQAVKQ